MDRLVALFLFLMPLPLTAQQVEVDVELALMADVSRSMEPNELEIQRRGYAEAIVSDEVVGAILNGFTGRIAITYIEWTGYGSQRVILPWTLIDSREAAVSAAKELTVNPPNRLRRTSISGAIDFARYDMERNEFQGLRQVIDVSGDGPNNQGRPVTLARDAAVEAGFVINGLPLLTYDPSSFWGIEDLDVYYQECVIGGPGAFVIPVLEWTEFPLAVRRKIVLELVGPPDVLFPVQSDTDAGSYDCLIGEKLRERRQNQMWDDF